jgi:exo-beta-1,3-glucanase (GH17 family)
MTAPRPVAWVRYALAAGLALALGAGFWYWLGRPLAVADALPAGQRLECVSYTPFLRDQSPLRPPFVITREQVDRDFALLSRYFACVRTYSVIGLEMIPEVAREHGLRVMLGAWVGVDEAVTEREIEGLIALAGRYPEVVSAVIVGNEVLLRREKTGAQMAELIGRVRGRVSQPVTYADVWEFWRKHPEVAPAVDFITIHLLPYWEDEPTGIEAALGQVRRVRQEMARQFPGRPILIGETGWPSEGRQRETAVPSRVNQALFVRGFARMAHEQGWRYNLIEAFDQPWKRDKEGAVGGYWGLFDTDRVDKGVLAGPVSNVPDWRGWLALSAMLAAGLLVAAGRPSSRAAAAAPLVAVAGAALAGYHLRYALLTARSPFEWAWLAAEVALTLVVTLWLALAASGAAVGWRGRLLAAVERRADWLVIAAGFGAAVLTLQLAFEPRYRDFPYWAYLMPALALLWVRLRERAPAPRPEPVLGALLLLGAPAVVAQESLANGPALVWVAVALAMAVGLAWPPGWRVSGLRRPAGQGER